MMRFVIAVLLVLNLATLAWQWGALTRWGWAPDTAREPERMLDQLRPEALKVETLTAFRQRMAAEASAADSDTASTAPTDPQTPAAASSAPDAPSVPPTRTTRATPAARTTPAPTTPP
jgi:cytoskeletal protein RodZ